MKRCSDGYGHLVQRGRNNPPVKKGSKAYCKSNIPSALEPRYFCLLALAILVSTAQLGRGRFYG
jgi:hypothetical protein